MRPPGLRASVAVLAFVLVALLGACQQGPSATEVDLTRLHTVEQDPALGQPTIDATAGPPKTSQNYRTVRSLLYSTVTTGDTTDPALDRPNRFIDKNWAESQEYAATLPAAGWQYTAIRCRALGGFDFLALKDYGDFTAAMTGTYDRRTANLSVQIPFNSEPSNPWQPAETIELNDTCLAAVRAPDSDGEKTNSNYQVRGVE